MTDLIFNVILAIVVVFLVLTVIIVLVLQIRSFYRELDDINREIARTTGEEQRRWQKEKRRLWLSLLPFYRG